MATNANRDGSDSRSLNLEDLDQIVGGAVPAQTQYDNLKQNLLSEINNADITNIVTTEAANIQNGSVTAAAAITAIETHASTDHVSEVAALAALDAATYGNAKVNGTDAVAAELTKVLTNGTGEQDMVHLAATTTANPANLISELDQAVQVLALGSANQNTALGLSTAAATDWVEAKLNTAVNAEVATDAVDVAVDTATVAAVAVQSALGEIPVSQFQADQAKLTSDASALSGATALQTDLYAPHQGEIAEGNAIDAVVTALGGNLTTIEQEAAALHGLTGTAALNEIQAAETATGLPNEVTLVALDLFSEGNATVQKALSSEYTGNALETNLATDVAMGGISANLAVETLNLIVDDLAQNSVNSSTIPVMEQGFAVATADTLLASDATALAATDTTAATLANSGYSPNAALAAADTHQAQLASGLATLINTSYANEVALSNELTALTNELGANASKYISEAESLITNPSLATGYISQIESAAEAAEAAATPGSTQGTFSADAALSLLAIYSHGNPTVLNELETRLVNGTTEADIANLVALGAISANEGVAILTQVVDTLASASPNNSVTLTGSDGHSISLDRTSALDWAEAQLAQVVLPMMNILPEDLANLASALVEGGSALTAAEKAFGLATAEAVNIAEFVGLLEYTDGQQVVAGFGIDAAWTAAAASADATAVINAGTSGYTLSADATAQLHAIDVAAGQRELADVNFAQQVTEANLNAYLAANPNSNQLIEMAGVDALTVTYGGDFMNNAILAVTQEFNIWQFSGSITASIMDPTAENIIDIPLNLGLIFVGILPDTANVFDLALQGMAALMDTGAAADVLGPELSGDLGAFWTTVHLGLSGVMGLFNDDVLLQGQAAVQLGQDAVQIARNTFTFSDDLAHGNYGALGGDAETLATNLGNAVLTFAEDYVGDIFIGIPIPEAGAMFSDIVQTLGSVEQSIMGNSDLASVANAISAESQSVLSGLEAMLGSSTDAAIVSGISDAVQWFSGVDGELKGWADSAIDGIDEIGSLLGI